VPISTERAQRYIRPQLLLGTFRGLAALNDRLAPGLGCANVTADGVRQRVRPRRAAPCVGGGGGGGVTPNVWRALQVSWAGAEDLSALAVRGAPAHHGCERAAA
jgi:hypothetical protein